MDNFIPWLSKRKLNLIQIQTTSVCNARCICCPYKDSWYLNNPGRMNDKLYNKIINDISSYDSEFSGKFCPYLCNEPFADKDILKRTELAYQKLHNPYVELSSNMGLLNKTKIDKLYELFKNNNFYGKFTISHHGINKETFENTMKIPYEKAKENMIYLLQKFDGQMKISIQNMAYSLDRKFSINPYRSISRYLEDIIEDNGISKQNLVIEPKVFHNRAGNVEIDGWEYDKIVRKIDKQTPFDCLRIHGCLHVIYTGEVILCCMDYFRETIINDLNNMTVEEHFKSDNWKYIYNQVRGREESPENFICKRCMSPGG